MTGLTFEPPGAHLFVRAVDEGRIRVGDRWHEASLVLSPEQVIDPWGPDSVSDLREEHFGPVLELAPSIVLLGTGARQEIVTPERLAPLLRRGVGVEVMTTEAACRTFNVLAGEGRPVVAALMPLRDEDEKG